jgi:hypothetical protein
MWHSKRTPTPWQWKDDSETPNIMQLFLLAMEHTCCRQLHYIMVMLAYSALCSAAYTRRASTAASASVRGEVSCASLTSHPSLSDQLESDIDAA